MCACIHVCMYVHTHTCLHVFAPVHIHICHYTYAHTCIHVRTHIHPGPIPVLSPTPPCTYPGCSPSQRPRDRRHHRHIFRSPPTPPSPSISFLPKPSVLTKVMKPQGTPMLNAGHLGAAGSPTLSPPCCVTSELSVCVLYALAALRFTQPPARIRYHAKCSPAFHPHNQPARHTALSPRVIYPLLCTKLLHNFAV